MNQPQNEAQTNGSPKRAQAAGVLSRKWQSHPTISGAFNNLDYKNGNGRNTVVYTGASQSRPVANSGQNIQIASSSSTADASDAIKPDVINSVGTANPAGAMNPSGASSGMLVLTQSESSSTSEPASINNIDNGLGNATNSNLDNQAGYTLSVDQGRYDAINVSSQSIAMPSMPFAESVSMQGMQTGQQVQSGQIGQQIQPDQQAQFNLSGQENQMTQQGMSFAGASLSGSFSALAYAASTGDNSNGASQPDSLPNNAMDGNAFGIMAENLTIDGVPSMQQPFDQQSFNPYGFGMPAMANGAITNGYDPSNNDAASQANAADEKQGMVKILIIGGIIAVVALAAIIAAAVFFFTSSSSQDADFSIGDTITRNADEDGVGASSSADEANDPSNRSSASNDSRESARLGTSGASNNSTESNGSNTSNGSGNSRSGNSNDGGSLYGSSASNAAANNSNSAADGFESSITYTSTHDPSGNAQNNERETNTHALPSAPYNEMTIVDTPDGIYAV